MNDMDEVFTQNKTLIQQLQSDNANLQLQLRDVQPNERTEIENLHNEIIKEKEAYI